VLSGVELPVAADHGSPRSPRRLRSAAAWPEDLVSGQKKGLVREITDVIWNSRGLDGIREA
jgi:hypothetical protein